MVRGLDSQSKARYRLRNVQDYFYLNQSGCFEVDDVDDAEEFQTVLAAMQQLNFAQPEIDSIFTLCSGVLHLGNLSFVATGDRKCTLQNKNVLGEVSAMLQVSPQQLEQVTTTRKMVVSGQAPITIGLGDSEARAARDALAKFIYEKLFDWLVARINESIGRGSNDQNVRTIGILDIFGLVALVYICKLATWCNALVPFHPSR